jgi:hypothetical protein
MEGLMGALGLLEGRTGLLTAAGRCEVELMEL